jgi:ectoine hydroxylase-related dioxygenase (phytanoyl-CoA dioxygenase family)
MASRFSASQLADETICSRVRKPMLCVSLKSLWVSTMATDASFRHSSAVQSYALPVEVPNMLIAAQDVDSLPDVSSNYSLSAAQITAFQHDGHILLRGLCTNREVDAYSPEIESAARAMNRETRGLNERDAFGKAFLQTLNLRYASPAVMRFAYARRFARVAAQLMGVKAVRIFHEQALFKEPGGGPTPWHQDQYYWPLDTPNTIGLWMPLVDVTPENGALVHASGSHRDGLIDQLSISERSNDVFADYIARRKFPVTSAAMTAGDATFHYGWTLHSAPPNRSAQMRKAMVITYFADGAKVIAPQHGSHENDRVKFLGGVAPGDFARSELNPILYSE